MKSFVVALELLLSVAACAGSASGQQGAGRIWITDVTIVSPENLNHVAEGSQAPKPPEASPYALEEQAMKTVTRILVENKLAPGGGTARNQRLGAGDGLLPRLVFSPRI